MATGTALYARRLAALPQLLAILELHPDGLPLTELATELGIDVPALREVLLAYYRADLVELGLFGQPVIEFFNAETRSDEEDEPDPATAEWIRVVASDPAQELGVDHLSAEQLALLHRAARDLLALEPDNQVLRGALDSFGTALWPSADSTSGEDPREPVARDLYRAAQERRRVRIDYVRQWRPGGGSRVIEPYRVVRTRRGWEVDAGPADDIAEVRTFLVSGIGAYQLLDEHFDLPADLDQRLASHRAATPVHVVVPQERRWVVERYAEKVHVLADDEELVSLTAHLLPPLADRLGLLLLVCGPDAFVVQPEDLQDAGRVVAERLLAHHRDAIRPN